MGSTGRCGGRLEKWGQVVVARRAVVVFGWRIGGDKSGFEAVGEEEEADQERTKGKGLEGWGKTEQGLFAAWT